MAWDNSSFYPAKYGDFFGCPLTVGIDNPIHIKDNIYELFRPYFNYELEPKMYKNWKDALKDPNCDLIARVAVITERHSYITSEVVLTDIVMYAIPPGEPVQSVRENVSHV